MAGMLSAVLSVLVLLGLCACETGSLIKMGTSPDRTWGVMKGSFRGRWWHYYHRGISHAEAGAWKEAEADLKHALKLRGKDQRRARTYGMHFLDYFPHRELGIVHFRRGRFQEATREIEESLCSEKSAKAEYYLDLARRERIRAEKAPVTAPEILLSSPNPDTWMRTSITRVEGLVRDPGFVKRVTVNGEPVRLDLAAREVPLRREVKLQGGRNLIVVEAANLEGRISRLERWVVLDSEGPTIGIEGVSRESGKKSPGFKIRGLVHDDAGLEEVAVNGRAVPVPPGKELRLDSPVFPAPGSDRILVEARDRLGNATRAEIPLPGSLSRERRAVVASKAPAPPVPDEGTQGGRDVLPPLIEVRNWSAQQAVFLDQVYLEACVRDESGIAEVRLNGRLVPRGMGKRVHLAHLASLEEGANDFLIEARDVHGNKAEKSVRFERRLQKVREIGSRLPVALLPLDRRPEGGGSATEVLEELILGDLVRQGRFALVERRRLEEILREQRLGAGGLADADTAVRIGKILAAGGMLMGTVRERGATLEIYLRLVDTETSLVIAAVDVYGEEQDVASLHELSRGLVLKLCDEVPLLEGTVVRVKDDRLTVDLGKESRLKRGMRVIVFREGEPVRHPLSGTLLGADVEMLGWGLVRAVGDQVSEVETSAGEGTRGFEPLQKVLTQ